MIQSAWLIDTGRHSALPGVGFRQPLSHGAAVGIRFQRGFQIALRNLLCPPRWFRVHNERISVESVI